MSLPDIAVPIIPESRVPTLATTPSTPARNKHQSASCFGGNCGGCSPQSSHDPCVGDAAMRDPCVGDKRSNHREDTVAPPSWWRTAIAVATTSFSDEAGISYHVSNLATERQSEREPTPERAPLVLLFILSPIFLSRSSFLLPLYANPRWPRNEQFFCK